MGTPRFHVERLTGQTLMLRGQEAIHAVRSRRLAAGEEVILFDGSGREAAGRITAVGRSGMEIAFGTIVSRPRPMPSLTLAVALPKGPRQDVLIEKCTELGTTAIVPLLSERSVSSASEHKLDRWRRTAIEAAKQSGQAWLPEFHSPEPLAEALGRVSGHDLAVMAATEKSCAPLWTELAPSASEGSRATDVPTRRWRSGLVHPPRSSEHDEAIVSILAFVGPEGGWTPEELELLTSHGCQPISLGPNILRIETAAIAIAALVHCLQQAER